MQRPSSLKKATGRLSCLAGMLAAACLLSSCDTTQPATTEAAKSQVIRDAAVRIYPAPANRRDILFSFQMMSGLFTGTEVRDAALPCEGVVGSVTPPLTIRQCLPSALTMPIEQLMVGMAKLTNSPDYTDRIILPNAARAWTAQLNNNDCWAAAFAMARTFEGLQSLTAKAIRDRGTSVCPAISQQERGASAYQITYIIRAFYRGQDKARLRAPPRLCNELLCIISELKGGHPIIVLAANHARVIVGIDYLSDTRYPKTPIPRRVYVLDPATNKNDPEKIKAVPFMALCTANIFLAY